MTTAAPNKMIIDVPYHIQVHDVDVEVRRKNIKRANLSVRPPDGRVQVSAPMRLEDKDVYEFVSSNLDWIHKQKTIFEQQARQPKSDFVSGESHYFEGQRYRLQVIHANDQPSQAYLRNKQQLVLVVPPGATYLECGTVLYDWYAQQMLTRLKELIIKWKRKLNIGGPLGTIRVQQMKTRWGSCNPRTRRLSFNLELIKKRPACLEYIVVHELMHLLEPSHNQRFKFLMSYYLPQWPSLRDELNQSPLAHTTPPA